MVGLVDIAPALESVDVQGVSVTAHGISAKGLAYLLGRFPELRMLMTGQEVTAEQLMTTGGEAVAAIIAAGCGYPGEESAEAVAGKLSLDAQVDLLAAILRLTLPKGFGPFVEKLTALGSLLDADGARSDTAPASKLRKPSTREHASATGKRSCINRSAGRAPYCDRTQGGSTGTGVLTSLNF